MLNVDADTPTDETALAASPIVEATNLCRTYYLGTSPRLAKRLTDAFCGLVYGSLGAEWVREEYIIEPLGCLDTADSGSLRINGKEVSGLTERERARLRGQEVGFVFQTFNLMPRLSALENVLLPTVFSTKGTDTPRERAHRLLDRVGLAERVDHRPNELSGGQRQRVAIARALVNDPDLLLADEPTGNLDSTTGEVIMDLLTELNADGRTIMLVTHERTIAEYADHIVHMLDGRIDSIESLGEANS